jgi:hypothetical protein
LLPPTDFSTVRDVVIAVVAALKLFAHFLLTSALTEAEPEASVKLFDANAATVLEEGMMEVVASENAPAGCGLTAEALGWSSSSRGCVIAVVQAELMMAAAPPIGTIGDSRPPEKTPDGTRRVSACVRAVAFPEKSTLALGVRLLGTTWLCGLAV